MPKAEVGSTKYIANKMKAKGLQRLRWYCQICEKQCRDENGFKQHTMSEGHVRAMLLVGEDPKKFINEYSNQFKRDFLQLLKTAHGEKKVHMNNFYQEYIRDKEHVHMNATKWPSLTEFAKYLSREGICRVEEGERGLEIQWINDSAEAIRRREDIKRKDKLARGDEALEAKMLERQIKAAQEEAQRRRDGGSDHTTNSVPSEISAEPVKLSLSLGDKSVTKQEESLKPQAPDAPVEISMFSFSDRTAPFEPDANKEGDAHADEEGMSTDTQSACAPQKVSLLLGSSKSKLANPLMAKRNPLSKKRDSSTVEPQKKMSNAERIMRDELERKRLTEQRGLGSAKRQRIG